MLLTCLKTIIFVGFSFFPLLSVSLLILLSACHFQQRTEMSLKKKKSLESHHRNWGKGYVVWHYSMEGLNKHLLTSVREPVTEGSNGAKGQLSEPGSFIGATCKNMVVFTCSSDFQSVGLHPFKVAYQVSCLSGLYSNS